MRTTKQINKNRHRIVRQTEATKKKKSSKRRMKLFWIRHKLTAMPMVLTAMFVVQMVVNFVYVFPGKCDWISILHRISAQTQRLPLSPIPLCHFLDFQTTHLWSHRLFYPFCCRSTGRMQCRQILTHSPTGSHAHRVCKHTTTTKIYEFFSLVLNTLLSPEHNQ